MNMILECWRQVAIDRSAVHDYQIQGDALEAKMVSLIYALVRKQLSFFL